MSALLEGWVRAMRRGDYAGAWEIEAQVAEARAGQCSDDPSLPFHQRWVWDGRELDGREVLVRCYHGLGDTIQYLRFLPELRARAASVTLEIPDRLIPLVEGASLADRIVPFDPANPAPPAERNVEIMELAFALRSEPPSAPPPYLRAAPASLPAGSIGLCTLAGDWDESRCIPADLLASACHGRHVVTLDPSPSSLPVLNPKGCPFDILQTARLIAGLSLVITVDTMVAHLAGAMNRPTWLLLKHRPDWRWAPETGRSDWYPAMRLYSQPHPGDWAGVADTVCRDLDRYHPREDKSHEPGPGLSASPRLMGRAAG